MFNRKNIDSIAHQRAQDGSVINANQRGRVWVFIAGILVFLLFIYVVGKVSQFTIKHKSINAVDLKVKIQEDLITGEDIMVNPKAGRMIIPVVGEGTYLLDMNLTTAATLPLGKISEKTFSFYAFSHDGKKLAGVNKQGIYILDLPTRQISTLIEGNAESLFYEEPYWAPDNETLYISRKNVDLNNIDQNDGLSTEILQISVDGKNMSKVTDGSYPSISSDNLLLIFAREGHIFMRNLKSGQESDLGSGKYPTLSPDVKYIACIKAKDEMEDVYVFSLKKPMDISKITVNFPNQNIRAEESQKSFDIGFYDYYNPVWGNDPFTLYVSRTGYSENPKMTIRKIKLSGTENTAKEMMYSWLEARINQDNETLRNLTDNVDVIEKEIIPQLNPQVLAITDSGREGSGLYIDVQSTFVNPVIPSYQIIKEHFNVENELEGYRIKRNQLSQDIKYYGKPDGIYKLEKGKEEKLLDLQGNSVSLISFNQSVDKLIYCIKEKGNYQIKSYNVSSKKKEEMDSFIPGDASLESIGISYTSQLMSVQFNYQGKKTIYIYNLKEQKLVPVPFLKDIKQAYWSGNNMKVDSGNDVFTLHWVYNPGLGSRFL
jgi:hypothetical protein